MSHFCVSQTDDHAAAAVSTEDSPTATAYVWGGASGNAHGQPVELWSPARSAKISANETYPPAPPGYIFSYTIPSQCIGLTFVGVNPGSTMRETKNSLRVGWDTAKGARGRSEGYTNVPTPGAVGRPSKITPALWARLLKFTKEHEGCTDFMYNDTGQQVTVGVGKLLKDAAAALSLKSYFYNHDGKEPSDDEIKDDHAAANSLTRTTNPSNLWDFAPLTLLRIRWDKVTELLGKTMGSLVGGMLAMSQFADFNNFPEDAKLASASISYGGINRAVLVGLLKAIQAQDWTLASQSCSVPGWDPNKNIAHAALYRSAATAAKAAKK